jgi:lactoylglutathione lyase
MPGAFLVGLQQKPLMFRSGGTVRLVSTYDEAIEFYSKKLGFELQEDAAFCESRWVTLSLPDQRDVTIALERATTDDDRALVGKQGGRFAFLGIYGNRIFMSQEPQN